MCKLNMTCLDVKFSSNFRLSHWAFCLIEGGCLHTNSGQDKWTIGLKYPIDVCWIDSLFWCDINSSRNSDNRDESIFFTVGMPKSALSKFMVTKWWKIIQTVHTIMSLKMDNLVLFALPLPCFFLPYFSIKSTSFLPLSLL